MGRVTYQNILIHKRHFFQISRRKRFLRILHRRRILVPGISLKCCGVARCAQTSEVELGAPYSICLPRDSCLWVTRPETDAGEPKASATMQNEVRKYRHFNSKPKLLLLVRINFGRQNKSRSGALVAIDALKIFICSPSATGVGGSLAWNRRKDCDVLRLHRALSVHILRRPERKTRRI